MALTFFVWFDALQRFLRWILHILKHHLSQNAIVSLAATKENGTRLNAVCVLFFLLLGLSFLDFNEYGRSKKQENEIRGVGTTRLE